MPELEPPEADEVRLVRCPKCEKILPELHSVYQCGGCGAVLRSAKTRDFDMDILAQKPHEEKVQVAEDNLYTQPDKFNFPEKSNFFSEGSDNDARFNGSSSNGNDLLQAQKWRVDDDLVRTETLHGFVHAESEGKFKDLGPSNGNIVGSQRSESFADWRRGIDGSSLEALSRNKNQASHTLRYSTSNYQEDGPSNYPLRPNYGYGDQAHDQNRANEFSKVEYLEQDRAELLRKLDELRDQINRSCDINDKPKEKSPLDPRIGRQEVTYLNKPSYTNQYNEASPYMHGYNHHLNSQMLQRGSHQEPNMYFPRQYIHGNIDRNGMNIHHPHCSCTHCYENHIRVSPLIQPTAFQNKTLPHETYNPIINRHLNNGSFCRSDYNSSVMNSHPLSAHKKMFSHLNSDMRGHGSRVSPGVMMTSGKRPLRPLSGGAPLFSCYNCFQLLEMPKKFTPTRTKHVKVKCGACLTINIFAVVNKKLIFVREDANMTLNTVANNPDLAVRGSNLHSSAGTNHVNTNFSSEDYDNCGYDFQLLDRESQGSGSNRSETTRGFQSLSSTSSELEAKTVLSPPLAGSSPCQNHFDHSSNYRAEKGNQSGSSDIENAELRKIKSRQNSMKNISYPTETEISFGEDINTGTSLESGDTIRDEYQSRGNKGAHSFFAGIIKKSLKDSSKSNNTVEEKPTDVMINGHPMTDKLLKKAEKVAGTVHPGKYWYDNRAGFWGVMDGPCLGIIPPFIKEFNHPMPENCAGGDTSIFVNGRELHRKDLKLLSSRGLPSTRDKSYIIEISGRVLDEDTGDELVSLGKLAPTVEKVKHGFGMKAPKVAA